MSTNRPHEFTAEETKELLDLLDQRLRDRGVGASIFVVGGAAIAATGVRRNRLTADVDALFRDQAVIAEARLIAEERNLPPNWLNPNANMWMPPLPPGVLEAPAEPGLRVTYAEDGFLLANKLIAQRAKDADDVVALADRLGLSAASPEQLEDHIRSYYTDEAMLEFIVDGNDVDREITLLAQDASRMLHRAAATTDTARRADSADDRLQHSTEQERREPPSSRPRGPDPGRDR